MSAGGASAATDDDASYVGILPFGAFKRHLAELQEAIDEASASDGHTLPGGVHLRLCAASKALYDDLSFGCPVNRLWHIQKFGAEAETALTNLKAELATADQERYAQACEDRKGALTRACAELRNAEVALRRQLTLLGRHPP